MLLHGVAFLSWNQHPEPKGSRRATPLLPVQHSSGQPRVWAPHSLSAGTSTTPRLSVSFLMAVIWSLLLSRSLGGRGSPWCDGQDGKRAHALGAVDQDPLDIRRCGWTGVESGIVAFAEFRPAISVMEI